VTVTESNAAGTPPAHIQQVNRNEILTERTMLMSVGAGGVLS